MSHLVSTVLLFSPAIMTVQVASGSSYLPHVEGPNPLYSPAIVHDCRGLSLSFGQHYVNKILASRHNPDTLEVVGRHFEATARSLLSSRFICLRERRPGPWG